MKIVLLGLGAVGYSFLNILKDNNLFKPDSFYCVDCNESNKDKFIKIGGLENNFLNLKINKNNYLDILNKLDTGDYLLDFCIDINNLEILRYCLNRGIHYLNTADSSWNPDPLWISDHQHYLEYLKLKENCDKALPTCIALFGMNPGLVSCFAKMCLTEIVHKDKSLFISILRPKLIKMLNKGNFNKVARIIGVTDIQEVDNDNQICSIPYCEDICYSTWNPWGFYYETISSAEIAFGTKRRYFKYKKVYDSDFDDLYLGLFNSGYKYKTSVFSPQGIVKGHISTHEEIFTIRKFFEYKKYRPTVHFVYSPCDYALKSIERFGINRPNNFYVIKREDIIDGGESVGIIMQGKRFKPRYYGNYLSTCILKETATVLQVSSSAYAAFLYMLNNPNCGLLLPEELDHIEVLNYAKKYLKEYISCECPKIDTSLGSKYD